MYFRRWQKHLSLPYKLILVLLKYYICLYPAKKVTLENECETLSHCDNCRVYAIHLSSVAQSCLTLCNPMDCSTPGLPVHHQLPEFTQTRVHWVSDAIQPSHPLLSLSPPTFNLSQHQGLLKWVSSLHQVAKVLILSETYLFYMFSQIISFRFSWSVSPHSFLLLNSYPSFLFTCLPVPKTSLCSFSNSWGWWLFCVQYFPASGSFQMSQFFASGGQTIGVSASTSVLPVNTQDNLL